MTACFIGIDWATREHQASAQSETGDDLEEKLFENSGDGLADLVDWIGLFCGGDFASTHVAIEIPHGAVVETLLEHGCQVFAINPKQLDRFRDRHSLAGAKDDRLDARVLATSLRTDRHCFRQLHAEDSDVIELREWSRLGDELKQDRVRLSNRLREQLRRYFPQVLELGGDIHERWILKLLEQIPTPKKAAKTQPRTVAAILKSHRIRRIDASRVVSILRKRPLSVAPGVAEAVSERVQLIVQQLTVLNEQIRECENRLGLILDRIVSSTPQQEEGEEGQKWQRDVEILRSFPGIGIIVLATLLSEAPQLVRQRDYQRIRAFAGTAPVTVRSGRSWKTIMRRSCNPRLRNACYHWARVATQHDKKAKAQYANLRARGKNHGQALRSVADRLLRVACAMLRNGESYDPLRAAA